VPTVVATPSFVCKGESTTITATGAYTYSWTNLGAGASIVITPTSAVNVTVTGTSLYNCKGVKTFKVFFSTCVNLDENTSDPVSVRVYPVPAADVINIAGQRTIQELNYAIYDLLGRKVMSGQLPGANSELSLDVSQLDEGMYLITFGKGDHVISSRFVVDR
jgi:hypothetical protein